MDDLEHLRTPALDELVGIAVANYDAAQLAYLAERFAAAAGAAFLREETDGPEKPSSKLRSLHAIEHPEGSHPRSSQPPGFGS